MKMITALLLSVLLTIPPLQAQSNRELRGKVEILDENEQFVRVASNVTVTISETQGSDLTNNNGAFRIPVPEVFRNGDRITLQVDLPNFAIFEPVGGSERIPADLIRDQITIRLLPQGAVQFLSGPVILL